MLGNEIARNFESIELRWMGKREYTPLAILAIHRAAARPPTRRSPATNEGPARALRREPTIATAHVLGM